MNFLTEDAVLVCDHVLGIVDIRATQDLVTVEGRRVLVQIDPELRPIKGCPNMGVTIKPCQMTLKVQKGYSQFIRIDRRSVCLDTVTGLTEGTPPGSVDYVVQDPGQDLVSEVV
jgi:hypothetical protein